MDSQAKPGALTRDVNTRLSTAETDPQTKSGAPAAAPAAVENKTFRPLFSGDPDLDHSGASLTANNHTGTFRLSLTSFRAAIYTPP